jgi:hypothetical protein
VTPVGVRDGDPEALAGLCDRRGPAVLAYCEVVAGRGEVAATAAADAFGSFRAGVVAAPDLANLNPEALLISATRHAAARYAGTDMPPDHARVPALLAARADRSITLADHDWLEAHLADCWTCRAPVARFEAADRAYLDPPAGALAPDVKAAMIAALTAAAPVLGAEPEPEPLRAQAPDAASPNGSGPHDPYALPAPEGYVEQPTSAYQIGVDDVDLVGAPLEAAAAAQPEARSARSRGLSRRPRSEGGAAASRRSRRARAATAAPATALAADATAVAAPEDPRAGRGTSLPRPQRALATSPRERRARPALRPGVVLPIALVILAIFIALIIAGVFGGGEPASNPQSFAPTSSEPVDTKPAPVVVVPGAATASAAAVEKAKARARRLAAGKKAAAGGTTTTAAATAPPPPPPPATAATQPAAQTDAASTPAKTATKDTSSSTATKKPKIDASQGATGAEELPQKKDTSSVPDLAPAAEPAAPQQ